jgi:two-component system sensor histidine kinase KdpD
MGVIAAVAAVTTVDFRIIHVNSPAAALSYLLLILALATRVGLQESILASVASMLAYNFFFLPPINTFTIADPQNWVALFVFLATAITASQLSSSARRKAEEASLREQEIQRMYEFSRALMLRENERSLADQITQKISELFGVPEVAFYDRETDSVCMLATADPLIQEPMLRDSARTGEIRRQAESAALIVPVRLGGRSLGSLGIAGSARISEVALQAIAQLVAIGLERARAQQAAARTEAARQNEQLKSTLLDALAHEFKTPLTSIKAAVTTMLSRGTFVEMEQDLLSVIEEETDHLNNLVTEAIELARISAGPVKLHRESYSVDELISSAMVPLRRLTEDRVLEVTVEPSLPPIEIDRRLSELALRQVLDNALKYSPASSEIQITVGREGDGIVISVSNAGPAVPNAEQDLIFAKFYRGRDARGRVPGTGMGLAIAREIIEAHGGRIWLDSVPGRRIQFSLTLPAMSSGERARTRQPQTVA